MYEIYKQAARELDLVLSPESPGLLTRRFDLVGRLDGFVIRIHRYVGRGGNVTFSVELPVPLEMGIDLERAGIFQRIARLLGSAPLRTGDASFDRRFELHAEHSSRALALLRPEVRSALTALPGDVRLDDVMLFTRLRHRGESLPLLLQTPKDLVRIAKLITERRSSGSQSN